MKALYSTSPCHEIEISGTASEWIAFASKVTCDSAVVHCEPVPNPAPYSHAATIIRVAHVNRQKLLVSISEEGEVSISADQEFIANLAGSASNLATTLPQGYHIHIDYLGEDHYVSKDSASTIFVRT